MRLRLSSCRRSRHSGTVVCRPIVGSTDERAHNCSFLRERFTTQFNGIAGHLNSTIPCIFILLPQSHHYAAPAPMTIDQEHPISPSQDPRRQADSGSPDPDEASSRGYASV